MQQGTPYRLQLSPHILPPLNHLPQHPLRNPHPLHRRRRTTINRRLHHRLANLQLADPIAHRPAHMYPELGHAVQRNQHPQVQQAALLAVEAGPVPDGAPSVRGDEVLEGAGEGGVVGGEGVVDVGVAEDGAAGLEALVVEVCCCGVVFIVIVGRHFGGMSGGGVLMVFLFWNWNWNCGCC